MTEKDKSDNSVALQRVTPSNDEFRWLRARKFNLPLDAIAEEDGVTLQEVEASVRKVERLRAKLTLSELHASEIEGLLGAVIDEHVAIRDALNAVKKVQLTDMRGRPVVNGEGAPVYVEEPDHKTRLEAIKARVQIMNTLQPRGAGFSVNMNNQTIVSTHGSRRGVEARIIEFNSIRERSVVVPDDSEEDPQEDEL